MQVYSLILPLWELCTLLPLLILSPFRAQSQAPFAVGRMGMRVGS